MGRLISIFLFSLLKTKFIALTNGYESVTEDRTTKKLTWIAVDISTIDWKIFDKSVIEYLDGIMKNFCKNATIDFTMYPINWLEVFQNNPSVRTDLERQDELKAGTFDFHSKLFVYCCRPNHKPDLCSEFNEFTFELLFAKYYLSMYFQKQEELEDEEDKEERAYYSEKTESGCFLNDGTVLPPKKNNFCFFMIDSQSKTVLYSGPFLMRKMDLRKQAYDEQTSVSFLASTNELCALDVHSQSPALKDGECYYSLSSLGYRVYCCCYSDPTMCSYITKQRDFYEYHANKLAWKNDPEIRMEYKEISNFEIAKWTKKLYLFSHRPRPDENFGKNKVLWYCTKGRVQIRPTDVTDEQKRKLRRKFRSELNLFRGRSCIVVINMKFTRNETDVLTDLDFNFSTDSQRECKHSCKVEQPECITHIFDEINLSLKIHCCCVAGDICNAEKMSRDWTKLIAEKNDDSIKHYCKNLRYSFISYYFFDKYEYENSYCATYFDVVTGEEIFLLSGHSYTDELSYDVEVYSEGFEENVECRLLEFQPFTQVVCLKYAFNYTQRVYTCRCKFGIAILHRALLFNNTEEIEECVLNPEFGRKMIESSRHESYCLYHNYCHDMSEPKKILAKRTALCYAVVIFDYAMGSMPTMRGEVSPVFMDTMVTNLVRRYKESHTEIGSYFMFTCRNSKHEPCNNEHFLAHSIEHTARTLSKKGKAPRPVTCTVVFKSEKISRYSTCYTIIGCFAIKILEGVTLAGCIESIVPITRNVDQLHILSLCFEQEFVNDECFGINSNEDGQIMEAYLCCCDENCWPKMQSFIANKNGFHPYDDWLEVSDFTPQ